MQGERHSLSAGVIYKLYKEHPCVQSIRAVRFLRAKRHSSTGTGCSHAHRGPESAGVTCTRGSQDEGKNRVGRAFALLDVGGQGLKVGDIGDALHRRGETISWSQGPTARTGVTRTLPCFVGGEAVSKSSAIERRDLAGLSRRDARSRRERGEHCLFTGKNNLSIQVRTAAQFALGLA